MNFESAILRNDSKMPTMKFKTSISDCKYFSTIDWQLSTSVVTM